ncbi:MAG: DegT/DnrJ/EryC1/StrS family aminotransferase [Dethiobacteria bacterium]|nr:DegT/DnrJ/EryC1/StrS family aminotransferase [Dethiobacteria bacterium]
MSGEEIKYIEDAFATNWIAPLGPHVDAFERELAEYLGVKGAAVLSSGTAAIHLSLILLGVGRGDRVFCSSLTFAATANPILYQGAEPVFIDADPHSWNMSVGALERALVDAEREGQLPKAVICVNLYGQSADLELIGALCEHYGVALVEDAAESLGATYKGKKSGSFGRFGILSFNGNKIITSSSGGALISGDLEALERTRYLATQARQPARHYEHTEAGYNYRLSNVLAGIGRGQLKVLDGRVEKRRAVFERYFEELGKVEAFEFMPEADYGRSTRWLTVLTVDKELCGVGRDDIIDGLEKKNIEARPVWKPMHLQPLYAGCRYYAHMKGSVSDRLFELGLCLPSGSNMTEEEQGRVIEVILGIIRK